MAPGDECHTAVKTDSERLALLLNTYVSVHTCDGDHKGYVDAIDPHSNSIILSTNIDNVPRIVLIVGHSVKEITPEEAPSNCLQNVIHNDTTHMNAEMLESRKCQVYNWLVRNLLPVNDDDGILSVHGGHLQIIPPYRPEDCTSSNTIILGRIQHLLQNIPKESPDD